MHDVALLGAGLHNSLICLALRSEHPELRLLVLEASARPLGEQIWSCHACELASGVPAWLEPAIAARWDGCELRFPGLSRRLGGEYLSLRAAGLRERLGRSLADPNDLVCNARVEAVGGDRIRLSDGREFRARHIIDGRGSDASLGQAAGFQKFLGQEWRCTRPHGLQRPLLMDATVAQLDGYRFLYVLPLEPDLLLVEDTSFADGPELEPDLLRARIEDYARSQGWSIASVEREERGILPMPWRGLPRAVQDGTLRSGFRGGWFHPATGYSLAVGIRLAQTIAADPSSLRDLRALTRLGDAHRRAARFTLLLNELQFRWYAPAKRRAIYERFFGLPDDLIRRFFALRSTRRDQARILCGRPPRGLSLRRRLRSTPRVSWSIPT